MCFQVVTKLLGTVKFSTVDFPDYVYRSVKSSSWKKKKKKGVTGQLKALHGFMGSTCCYERCNHLENKRHLIKGDEWTIKWWRRA